MRRARRARRQFVEMGGDHAPGALHRDLHDEGAEREQDRRRANRPRAAAPAARSATAMVIALTRPIFSEKWPKDRPPAIAPRLATMMIQLTVPGSNLCCFCRKVG